MNTRLGPVVAAALLLTIGCGEHSSPTDQPLSGIQGKGGVLSGEVLGLQFSDADSALVPVPSRVLAFNVGLIPPDSLASPLTLRMPLGDPGTGDTIVSPPPPPPPPPPSDTVVTRRLPVTPSSPAATTGAHLRPRGRAHRSSRNRRGRAVRIRGTRRRALRPQGRAAQFCVR